MKTIEELLASMQAILDGADGRDLTDDEVGQYEALEADVASRRRTAEITARQTAYTTPITNRAPLGTVAPGRVDNGLDLAFEAYLRTGQPNADIAGLQNTMSTGAGAQGGYTVPPTFQTTIVEAMKAFGGFGNIVTQQPTTTGEPITWPTLDDTANAGTQVDEGEAPTTGADLTFGTGSLSAYEYTSQGPDGSPLRISWALLQDSAVDIAGLVARALGTRLARAMAPAIVTGTGVKQPLGILASGLTPDRDLDTADALDYEDLVELTDLLDDAYEPGARWLMRRNTWTQLRLLVDGNGRPLIQSALDGISGRPTPTLLGYPVTFDPAVPLLSSAGVTLPLAFGDFAESYVQRRVGGIQLIVNPYSRSTYRETEFMSWTRMDGTVKNRSAYKIMRNNT